MIVKTFRRDAGRILTTSLIFISLQASAYVAKDTATLVSANVSTSPAAITLSWPLKSTATTPYQVSRKLLVDTTWTLLSNSVPANSTGYADTNVVTGETYEYKIYQAAGATPVAYGYVAAGIEIPGIEDRGKLLLLVDDTFTVTLSNELARLERDLVGDGWTLLRQDVSRNDTVTNIKAIIQAEYSANPTLKSLFIFGHVPVPYSGNIAPDGHSNHYGAWPADLYYGDMDGTWTDTSVSNISASSTRNHNIPGDGKFDQSSIPSPLELQVGRVDLSGLTYFSESEEDLLRRYLAKDYKFRHKMFDVTQRGLIDDNFGYFNGEAFAASGWRAGSAFFGAANVQSEDWLTTLDNNPRLFSYGCGSGNYTSARGVASTLDFATNQVHTVFTLLFGSYFGDWDSANNFLRAPLASDPWALTCGWAGRPHWFMHHMGMGMPIGHSTRVSQNNTLTEYMYPLDRSYSRGGIHVALMGDPSLRLHSVAPPSQLLTVTNMAGEVELDWVASTETVGGYHIYGSTNIMGPYSRLNGSLITSTDFTDTAPATGTNYYMVRAQKLEDAAGGTYYNLSQGIFGANPSPEVELVVSSGISGVTASPSLGTNTYSAYDSSVISKMIDTELIFGSTQHVVIGWIGTGDIPATGNGTETLLTELKQNSSIDWQWGTNFWVDIFPDTNGIVDVSSGWKRSDTNLSLQATATAFMYVFSHWSGADVPVGHETDNPLVLTIDAPSAITANFMPSPNPDNRLLYAESFESYLPGSSLVGTNGWHGRTFESMLITTNAELIDAIADYGSSNIYPINVSHDKAVVVDDVEVNFTGTSNTTVVMEMIVQFSLSGTIDDPDLGGALPQFSVSLTPENEFMLYHANPETAEVVWTTFTNIYVSTVKVHVLTVELDYLTAGLGYKYFRVSIDGNAWMTHADGYTSNDGAGISGGFWFANADASATGINKITFMNKAYIDDLVVAEGDGTPGGDRDGDGMWDKWEIEKFGATNAPGGDPGNDLDTDGMDNVDEYIADTDPDADDSFLALTNITKDATGVRLCWHGGRQSRQFIDFNTNLLETVDGWQPVASNSPPTEIDMQWLHTDATNDNAGFYRVRAQRP